MELFFKVNDKPSIKQTLVFALQQLLAILAATIAVPAIINSNKDVIAHFTALDPLGFDGVGMSASAALFGAGVGTLVYLLFTKFKSPVFLGSSFAFLGSMAAAFCGATTVAMGFTGLVFGAILAGLVYVVIALVVKKVGTEWINKLMPAVVIGPTVAIIGLSLAGNAIGDLKNGGVGGNTYVGIICGLVTLLVTIACSVFGKKMIKMIPFIIGICAGYLTATIFSLIGLIDGCEGVKVINWSLFENMKWYPDFTFIKAFKGFKDFADFGEFMGFLGTVAVAYVPVAFVVFAEHIADHKNLSSIIETNLLEDPGLDKTLLGDGVGSMAGAFFGGCPNTTYGESVGCVAISGNASIVTIFATALLAILSSFIAPFTTFLSTIPSCVMGGVCVALYGFIAVSGLKMVQKVDLEDNRNLFVVSVILIAGIGGLSVSFGKVTLTTIACALILGIVVNIICHIGQKNEVNEPQEIEETTEE